MNDGHRFAIPMLGMTKHLTDLSRATIFLLAKTCHGKAWHKGVRVRVRVGELSESYILGGIDFPKKL